MSVTYFPCIAIYSNKRLVYSFSTIQSITSTFDAMIVDYLMNQDTNEKLYDESNIMNSKIREISNFQIYHIYAYCVNATDTIFMLTSIIIAEKPLKNIMDKAYDLYNHSRISSSMLRNRLYADCNQHLNDCVLNLFLQFEKEMSF